MNIYEGEEEVVEGEGLQAAGLTLLVTNLPEECIICILSIHEGEEEVVEGEGLQAAGLLVIYLPTILFIFIHICILINYLYNKIYSYIKCRFFL